MRVSSEYLVQERQILLEKCKTFLDVGNPYLTPSSEWMFCGFLCAVKLCAKCTDHTQVGIVDRGTRVLFDSIKSIAFEKPSRYNGVCVCVRADVCVCRYMLCGKAWMSWWNQKEHWSSVPSIVTTWCKGCYQNMVIVGGRVQQFDWYEILVWWTVHDGLVCMIDQLV